MNKHECEQRAIDALIVLALRGRVAEIDMEHVVPEHLPKLTDEEREALDALGPDFVERLLARDLKDRTK